MRTYLSLMILEPGVFSFHNGGKFWIRVSLKRGHSQTKYTKMGGGVIHEISKLLNEKYKSY